MIKLKTLDVQGFEPAIHGMRNPMNSWSKSDSHFCHWDKGCSVCEGNHTDECQFGLILGPNDRQLALQLANAGPVHGKFRRMITVWVDITAPLYWWKEFDTYKVGTVANSCSTMHKIHDKKFTLDDFSHEHLITDGSIHQLDITPIASLEMLVDYLNVCRDMYNTTKDKKWWWQMIQLLPSSYNQTRTVQLNYEVLANICQYRENHRLDEWRSFIEWAMTLPYPEIFKGEN